MNHLADATLAGLAFEPAGSVRAEVAGHLAGCAACRSTLAELRQVEQALTPLAELPPADGFARVMARVGPAPSPPAHGGSARFGFQILGAMLLAGLVVVHVGDAVSSAASGWGLGLPGVAWAALGFFALGSAATLAVAPMLIIEGRRERGTGSGLKEVA